MIETETSRQLEVSFYKAKLY